jgi:iron complex transport system substrate-binding protein
MTTRKLKATAYHLIVAVAAVALVGIITITAYNADSNTTRKPAVPKRIISMVPSNTEILFALGLGDRIVGVTRYCNYPAAALKKPKIGDMNASAEKIVSLKPDLVLAHSYLNDNVTRRLTGAGIRVLAIDPKSFSQVYADIGKIGGATGKSREAEVLVKKMAAKVSYVRSKTARSKPKKVLIIIQPNPLWAAGPSSIVDEMLRYSHASNVARDAHPGYNQFSTEVAVSRNPDVIIVSRQQEREFILKSAIWARTTAVRKHAVHVVDGDLLLRAGPRISEGLVKLAGTIHPEDFR